MSVFRGGKNGGHYYSNITQPIAINANFVVDSSNGNGLGIRSLKSNGWIRNVFMHTSASPGANNGVTNPNPASGFALIQFKQNFNIYLGGFSGFVSPVSGSPLTSVTQHAAYIIVSLGTTTLAQWQAVGVPAGLTPSVGMSFIATATQAIGGTGAVEVPSVSGITSVEVVGDPNQSISNASIAANGGAYVLVQFLAATSSSVTTLVATAPANNSVVGMSFYFDQSSADPIMMNGDPSSI
jgi:hypothetical protein